ncbi:hypothetical protein OZX62_00070 [Bifidobacterium sp. ESL0690]|uniref:hypothetical protein n=1 Tax=Bifidobacterium sp. ESL0690 TaxID=2983214 RepID=UPI0023F95944|nr:hypothetical protein [Bifidobacterium sp. ESL0690]WEV46747.1 hypothetical protein OZX62_00070 [Bifidobacterium sp. ESL0690]
MMGNLAIAISGTSFLLLPVVVVGFPSYSLWSLLVTAIGLIPALFAIISQRKVDDKAQRFLDDKETLLQERTPTPKLPTEAESASSRLRFKDEFAGEDLKPNDLDSKIQYKYSGCQRLMPYIVILSLMAIFILTLWEITAELQFLSPISWSVSITQCTIIAMACVGYYRIYLHPDYRWLAALKGTMYLSVLFGVLSILVAIFLPKFVPQTICATAFTLFIIFLYRWLVANTERY